MIAVTRAPVAPADELLPERVADRAAEGRAMRRAAAVARAAVWVLLAAVAVLASRAVVYALAPSRGLLLEALARRQGGPHLAGVLTAAVLIAAVAAIVVLWLAVVAVRERLALEGRALVAAPRLSLPRLAVRAALFFAVTSFAFAMLESYIHWRAGLGWHGLECLYGPVHRDAVPILAALSLVTVAVHGAIEHLLAWARRLVAQLAARVVRPRAPAPGVSPAGLVRSQFTWSDVFPRGPPDGAVPVLPA